MKAKIKETGEIIDVEPVFDYWGEFVCYERGKIEDKTYETYSKYELDFDTKSKEFDPKDFYKGATIVQDTIDWEQQRVEIAKSILSSIYLKDGVTIKDMQNISNGTWRERYAVSVADSLIKQLKGE